MDNKENTEKSYWSTFVPSFFRYKWYFFAGLLALIIIVYLIIKNKK